MIPDDLRYTDAHEWVRDLGDGVVRVGITDHAQTQLGDVVFVQLPDEGADVQAGAAVGDGLGTACPPPLTASRTSSATIRTASSPASFCADSAPRPSPWGRTGSAADGCTRWNKPLHSRQRTASTANGRNPPQSRSEYVVITLTAPSRGRVAEPGRCHTRITCRVRRSRISVQARVKVGPKAPREPG